MEVLGRLLALLAVLLAGTGLRAVGVLGSDRRERLNAVAYYLALPALVFVATYDRALGDVASWGLLVAVVTAYLGTALLAWIVHRNRVPSGRRGVAVVQSYHSNLGYLGIPLIAATFDAEITAIASLVLGIGLLIQVPLTVLVLVSLRDGGPAVDLGGRLRSLATNPVLVALAAGIGVGALGLSVPPAAALALDGVGSLALPLALICVGASLTADPSALDGPAIVSVVALKLACMPAIAWAAFALLGAGPATLTAGVVMVGTPAAVSTYVFAAELGGDTEFASLTVFVTTVVSVGTLTALSELVRTAA